jgi:hypothetical protein
VPYAVDEPTPWDVCAVHPEGIVTTEHSSLAQATPISTNVVCDRVNDDEIEPDPVVGELITEKDPTLLRPIIDIASSVAVDTVHVLDV